MPLPNEMTREHVLKAIQQLDAGVQHPFGPSVDYDVVFNGHTYPPKAIAGLAAALATGRTYGPNDFSAGEGPGQANTVLRALGFTVEKKIAPSRGPERLAFTAADCELFVRNRSGSLWEDVTPEDQERFKDLRLRLKTLAEKLAPIATSVSVPVSSIASLTAPNGRAPREIWSCVFPRMVGNKSFALQFAVIVNGRGSEICCCLGAGTSQETDPATLTRLQETWKHLQTALGRVSDQVQQALQHQIGTRWQLRRSWLEEPDQRDFATLGEWLQYATSDQGAGASISRNLTPQQLEAEGDRLVETLARDLQTFGPLFLSAYGWSGAPTTTVAPETLQIHPKLSDELTNLHDRLVLDGELPSREALQRYYDTFRQRFGPDVLRTVNGEALLSLMHETTKDGLVYWLEFKDDDEFPATFGSIAGGSALKFGLYRRRETGAWMAGSPTAQRELTTAEAIQIAQRHRDQLMAAHDLFLRFPTNADDRAYQDLQKELVRVAPDVQDSAWGHKYLSLLHPDKLDDYHVPAYSRFHLIKLLQHPVDGDGRYLNAGRFVALARLFDWPINHLTTVLNRRDGSPHRYWRIGTTLDARQSFWPMMRDESIVAIGWRNVGDLSSLLKATNLRDAVREKVANHYPNVAQVITRAAQQLVQFCSTMQERDYVLACDGDTVLGVGRVSGPYSFDAKTEFAHARRVDWLSLGEWHLPVTEGLQTTVHEYGRHTANLVAIEARVLEEPTTSPGPTKRITSPAALKPSVTVGGIRWETDGVVGQIQDVLDRKGQVILYGPPGTGKTYWAELAARHLAALWNFGARFDDLDDNDRTQIVGLRSNAFVQLCSFHPGYGYEDFIEGYRPIVVGGTLQFERQDGIFKVLCDEASRRPAQRFYLIVDEINRGDIPRIFGELITALDKPKRGTGVILPLSKQILTVPSNLFVIGTMNTADRSIALLDAALRRRFGFIELLPDPKIFGNTVIDGIALGPWLTAINRLITEQVGRDGRNLQIGHSYFLVSGRPIQDFAQLARILREDILPLLEEYCYDDWDSLDRILGAGLVDVTNRRFKIELFEPNRKDDLVQALLAPTPDVQTSAIAVSADADTQVPTDDAEGDDDVG